ncbi:hypothetical protein [Nannocystis radixulma]|uniref:Uncharacterized protein n=1 Tax=Nannocystis radixulma TaxID=2995305 RepID=A0ABT5BKT0_9BACT|nr:hypothetical protein [Nannocystis radixulma]MDC0674758.1 hypothetical protein [Nannocystis radixulma]
MNCNVVLPKLREAMKRSRRRRVRARVRVAVPGPLLLAALAASSDERIAPLALLCGCPLDEERRERGYERRGE